jgi:SAM-dependent methyltransferase
VSLYEGRLADTGYDHRTVGWGSTESQRLRFEQLFRGIDPRGKRILDVGCGLGDLIPFLDARTGGDYDYVGADIATGLVDAARARHGGKRRELVAIDILDADPPGARFDIAVLSGALNFRIGDNVGHARAMLGRMFALTRELSAANFLSTNVDFQLIRNFHYAPSVIAQLAAELSPRFALYHDYPLYELTVHIGHSQRTR